MIVLAKELYTLSPLTPPFSFGGFPIFPSYEHVVIAPGCPDPSQALRMKSLLVHSSLLLPVFSCKLLAKAFNHSSEVKPLKVYAFVCALQE